jgi:hypothetical protein
MNSQDYLTAAANLRALYEQTACELTRQYLSAAISNATIASAEQLLREIRALRARTEGACHE